MTTYNPALPFRIWYAPGCRVAPGNRAALFRVDSFATLDAVLAAARNLPHGHVLLRLTIGPDDQVRDLWPFVEDQRMVTVFAFEVYNINTDRQPRSRYLATAEAIQRISGASRIEETRTQVPALLLNGNGMIRVAA